MKSDKVTEQSDSWFPARNADLLVACSLNHTVPKWYGGATLSAKVVQWGNSGTQCRAVPHSAISATPLILSNRSIPPFAPGALYIAVDKFCALILIIISDPFDKQISEMGIKQSKRTVDISSTPKKGGDTPAKVNI